MSSADWYALLSKPHKERQVESYLQAKQIEVFYPTLAVKPVNPRAAHERALFPRYLFVHVDLASLGTNVLQWLPGAVGLVCFDGEPASIPDSFIVDIQKRMAKIKQAGGLHLHGLKKGEGVQIIDGPFAGYEAIFDMYLKDEDRVQVFLQWLGRQTKLKLNANAVNKRRPY